MKDHTRGRYMDAVVAVAARGEAPTVESVKKEFGPDCAKTSIGDAIYQYRMENKAVNPTWPTPDQTQQQAA